MSALPAAVDLSRVSRSAQDSRSIAECIGILAMALVALALFWLLVYLWNRYRNEVRRAANDPRALFHELCRAHGLNRHERHLLWNAAVQFRLEHPALVFALPHYVHQLAGAPQPQSADYARLAVRLFGSAGGGMAAIDMEPICTDADTTGRTSDAIAAADV